MSRLRESDTVDRYRNPIMQQGDSMLLTVLFGGVCLAYSCVSLAMTGYWAWRVWLR